jgi:hypothetical protein
MIRRELCSNHLAVIRSVVPPLGIFFDKRQQLLSTLVQRNLLGQVPEKRASVSPNSVFAMCSTGYRCEGRHMAGALHVRTDSRALFRHTRQDGSAYVALCAGTGSNLSYLPKNNPHVGEVECHGIAFQKIVAEHAGEMKTKLVFPRKRAVVEACYVLLCNFA